MNFPNFSSPPPNFKPNTSHLNWNAASQTYKDNITHKSDQSASSNVPSHFQKQDYTSTNYNQSNKRKAQYSTRVEEPSQSHDSIDRKRENIPQPYPSDRNTYFKNEIINQNDRPAISYGNSPKIEQNGVINSAEFRFHIQRIPPQPQVASNYFQPAGTSGGPAKYTLGYYVPGQQPGYADGYAPNAQFPIAPPAFPSLPNSLPPLPTYFAPPPPIPQNPPSPQIPHHPPLPVPTGNYYTQPQSYMRNYHYNRRTDMNDADPKKNNRKRKKPLSQNIPQKKDWSVEDARKAIEMEKEYNKRVKSLSLIIKFPDKELNREIVHSFHPSIESVHFQQPSIPRFCFVNLQDSADGDKVIEDLNKTHFGQGFLTAEYKKDREDDLEIGPEDIDPLTLYVGNLAQDVTKEDMVKAFPRQKRIDIGYAKKMKYTRYAFVAFKNVYDSIEAFKRTHSTQMYSKSLIVRFRRLHGPVGMPGEPKPQHSQRVETDLQNYHSHNHTDEKDNACEASPQAPWEMVDVSRWVSDKLIKEEHMETISDDETDVKPTTIPKLTVEEDNKRNIIGKINGTWTDIKGVKINSEENLIFDKLDEGLDKRTNICKLDHIPSESILEPQVKLEQEVNQSGTFSQLRALWRMTNSGNRLNAAVEVKEEVKSLEPDLSTNLENEPHSDWSGVHVKTETYEDEVNDGDDDSSLDDFNVHSILSGIEERKNKMKKLKASML